MNLGLNEIFAVIDKVKSAELEGFEYSDVDMKIKIKNCGGKAMGRSFSSGMQMTGAEMDTLKTNMQGSSMARCRGIIFRGIICRKSIPGGKIYRKRKCRDSTYGYRAHSG